LKQTVESIMGDRAQPTPRLGELMQSIMLILIALFFFGSLAEKAGAQQIPSDQQGQPHGRIETPLPKPGDPRYSATLNFLSRQKSETRDAGESCLRHYLSGKATPNSEVKKLSAEACRQCKLEMIGEAKAANELDRLLSVQFEYNSKTYCGMAELYGSQAIEFKKREADLALEPIRGANFKTKLVPAIECQRKYTLGLALSTAESPENISSAAFNKCIGLFQDAVEALVRPSFLFGEGRLKELIAERVAQLQKEALPKSIEIVVEARSRHKIAPPGPPADSHIDQSPKNSKI
jgi:hypothetical protein